jgi:tetratricopeptide (TPR) repeat protein
VSLERGVLPGAGPHDSNVCGLVVDAMRIRIAGPSKSAVWLCAIAVPVVLRVSADLEAAAGGRSSVTSATVSDSQNILGTYQHQLDSYRAGRTRDAVTELSALAPDQVRVLLGFWQLRISGGASGAPSASPPELQLAAMLHTDCAFAIYLAFDFARGDAHMRLAQFLVDSAFPGPSSPGSWPRRWYLVALMFLQRRAAVGMADDIRKAGLSAFPHDAPLLLEAGVMEERMARMVRPSFLLDEDGLRKTLAARDVHLRDAQRYLERVPDDALESLEARLRLGRVRSELGHPEEAIPLLEGVVESSSVPIAYMANLLLGEIHERRDLLDRAVTRYQAAVTLIPSSQVARTALAHALFRQGHSETAVKLVREGLDAGSQEAGEEPWWRYQQDQFRSFDELLMGLREAVQQ